MSLAVTALILAAAATSIEVTVLGPAGALAGTLTLPAKGHAPFPAVVTLTGSGAHHRNGNRTPEHPYRYRIENDPSIPPAGREAALAEAMRQQAINVVSGGEAWRGSIQDRDPLPTARRMRMPILILQGLNDRAVNPEDAGMLERAIREAGNRRVVRRLFPGVNHHFQRDPVGAREGYDRLPVQTLAPEVLATLCSWLPATLR